MAKSHKNKFKPTVGVYQRALAKKTNKCLSSTSGPLNLICGVNVSIEDVRPMEDSALVVKICGRNPSSEDMEIWVTKNWSSVLNYELEIGALTKGWLEFIFNYVSDVGKILAK